MGIYNTIIMRKSPVRDRLYEVEKQRPRLIFSINYFVIFAYTVLNTEKRKYLFLFYVITFTYISNTMLLLLLRSKNFGKTTRTSKYEDYFPQYYVFY